MLLSEIITCDPLIYTRGSIRALLPTSAVDIMVSEKIFYVSMGANHPQDVDYLDPRGMVSNLMENSVGLQFLK